MSIIEIKDKTDDSLHWDIEATLEEVLRQIKAGEVKPTRMALVLDDGEALRLTLSKCGLADAHLILTGGARILEDDFLYGEE